MRLLLAVVLTVLPFAAAPTAEQRADDDAHDWALRHYARVLDAVLPIEAPLNVAARNLKWGVRLRIVPAFGLESTYTLLKGFDGDATATVTMLSDDSVLTQLEGLYAQHRNSEAGKLPVLIKRTTRELTLKKCPALKGSAQAFEGLKISVSLAGALQMDATGYELFSDGRSGTLRLSIAAPYPAPVVEWAERLRKSVAGCAAR